MNDGEIVLTERIERHLAERVELKEVLRLAGKSAVNRRLETRSLRELSRLTGLSATYLSQVRSGETTISMGAYLRLLEVEL